jgi:polysaccharide deacetylase family protein (PEP-CTERM system associated)
MTLENYLTVDVEDYFQVSAFDNVSLRCVWDQQELRVEANTERVLALLSSAGIQATFFVLGWVAKQCPGLVRTIAEEGHEIASHGYGHRRVCHQSREEFRQDIRRSKGLLEDICGTPVMGYRAPSYSISHQCFWAFDELHAAGFSYDSSIFPIRHDYYGIPDWPRFRSLASPDESGSWRPSRQDEPGRPQLLELPITTLNLLGVNVPIAGGGYFRLFPYELTRMGLERINRKECRPFVFYFHPWEIDPLQPRMTRASWKSRFRHYVNLDKTESRLQKLMRDFHFVSLKNAVRTKNRDMQPSRDR